MLDRNKLSPYDLDETHGPVNIQKNGYGYFGYDFYASKVGTYYFYVVTYSNYNNKYVVTDQHVWYKAFNVLDTEKPSVTVTFPNGGEKFQVGMSTNILWTATDNVGVTSIDIYYSTDGGSTWKTIATGESNDGTYTWTIPDTPSKTCRVKVVAHDVAGNSGEDTSNANFEIYKPDTTPPSASISINNGATYTNTRSVTLYLTYSDSGSGVDKVRYKNFGESYTSWESPSSTKSWTLRSGTGSRIVYYQVRDKAGNIREVYDSIVLDTTPPPAPSPDDGIYGWSNDNTPTFSWSAPSDTSGIAGYYWKVGSGSETWTTSTSVTLPAQSDGIRTFYVRAKDNAGNIGNYGSHQFKIDTAKPPVPSPDDGVSGWSNDNTPTFSWSVPSDTSGIAGYYWKVGSGSETWTTSTSVTLPSQSDGICTFSVRAKDNAGNVGNYGSHEFKIDTANPPAPSPDDGVTGWSNDNTPTFSWSTPSDTSGIAGYYWKVGSGSETWATSTSVTLPAQSDGIRTFYVRAKDNAGNIGNYGSHQFKIDTANPPAPSPDDGVSGWSTDNTPTFSWSAPSDTSGIADYYWKVGSGSETWITSTSVTLPAQSDGIRTFYVRAKDNAGNIGNYGSHEFKIDTTKPSSHVNALSPTQTTTSFTVSWTGSDTGGSGLKWYDIQYKDGSSGTWTNWKTQTTSTSATFGPNNPITVQSGHTYYFQSIAQDNAGNWETYPGGDGDTHTTISVPDTTPPTISITSPTDGRVFTTATIIVSGTASDNVGLSKVEVKAESGSWQTASGTSSWSKSVTLASGSNTIYAKATDTSGNTAETSVTVTYNLPDTTPPTVTVNSPNGGEIWNVGTTHHITWTATDNVGVTSVDIKYSTNGGSTYPYTIATGEPNDGTYTWTIPNSPSTTCKVKVIAYDADGNSGEDASNSNFIIFSNNPPNTPSNPSPVNHATDQSIHADLSWTGGDPDAGDTVTYNVYFGTSTSPPLVSNDQSGTTYDPGTLSYNTKYYWKIIATDNHGASTSGHLWDFTTGSSPNNPPNMPSNPSPSNHATDQSIHADLSWTGGDPDAGDTVTYDIYFGTSTSPPLVSNDQSGASYDPCALSYDTKYYWKIIATDNHGASTSGHLWDFTTTGRPSEGIFDTGLGTYPSISGMHNGTIKPNQTIIVQKLYTYPCAGTGGHTEYARIWNESGWNVTAIWDGYVGDWHNVTFDDPFTLFAEKTYYYEIRTGSYPQIIHKPEHTTLGGSFINCNRFIDANGKEYTDWIPAIKLFL